MAVLNSLALHAFILELKYSKPRQGYTKLVLSRTSHTGIVLINYAKENHFYLKDLSLMGHTFANEGSCHSMAINKATEDECELILKPIDVEFV